MKKYFLQKILQKFEPKIIYIVGKRGKSMAATAILDLLVDRAQDTAYIDVKKDQLAALTCLKQRFSIFTALKYAFFSSTYPQYVICELHTEPKFFPEMVQVYVVQTHGYDSSHTFADNVIIIDQESVIKSDFVDVITTDEESYSIDKRIQGIFCKVLNGGSSLPLQIYGGIGKPHVDASLLALNFAHSLKINLLEAINSLRKHELIPGRMKLIPGIKKSLLIDDTYDTEPETLLMALEEVMSIPIHEGKRKILVLGDMYHLGAQTETQHCQVGQAIAELGFDFVVGIGEKMYDLLQCAKSAGLSDGQLHHFTSVEEAGKFVQHELHSDELVFVKGAREDRLERVIKELMAFPLRAKDDLLQR